MEKFNRNDWEKSLSDAVIRAVDARRDYGQSIGEKHRDDQNDVWFKQYLSKIKTEMPFEDFDENDFARLEKFKGEDMFRWLDRNFGGKSPREVEKTEDAEKFLPLIAGANNYGRNWYSMSETELKGIGRDLGYDVSTKEGFAAFLKKIGEYQQDFDKAQNVADMKNAKLGIPGTNIEFGPKGSAYILGSLVSPSATREIENAVATGEGGDAGTVAALTGLDAGANSLIFGAPGLSATGRTAPFMNIVTKGNKVATPVADAVLQGVIEGGRQAGKQGISETGQEFDPTAAILATSIGATRPSLVGGASTALRTVPGPQANQFSRGVMMATRSGNPAWLERDGIESIVKDFNKRMLAGEYAAGRSATMPLGESKNFLATNKVPEMAKFFGVKAEKDGTYDVAKILNEYDKKLVQAVEANAEGVVVPTSNGIAKEGEFLITPENESVYRQLFGAKVEDEMGRNAWRNAGYATGRILGDVGGRVEPAIKGNPLNGEKLLDKKEREWQKRLSAESRKIIDAAIKAKLEEDEKK